MGVDPSRTHAALLELAALDKTNFGAALELILKTNAHVLGVARVNFWFLREPPLAIECAASYLASHDVYERGARLFAVDSPAYFAAILDETVVVAPDARHDPRTSELTESYLDPLGIRAMMDVPVWVDGTLTGILCHENTGERQWEPDEISFALAVGQMVATAIESHARHKAEAAERRAAFLSGATAMLAESLDGEEMPSQLSRYAVPFLADWCVLDLLEGDRVVRVSGYHGDPAKAELMAKMRACDSRCAPIGRFLWRGQPLLLPNASVDNLTALCDHDNDHVRLVRELGTVSVMAAPLVRRGRVLGALGFGAVQRRFGFTDLDLAQELARRTAVAIENGRLYRQTQDALRIRDEFLSIAAHELYTPITSLQLTLQSLGTHLGGPLAPTVERALSIAERQTRRLTALIDTLLTVPQAQGDIPLSLEQIDLATVAQEVANNLAEQMAFAGCRLDLDAPEPVIGRWDRMRLEQVVTNLLTNAIKYAPATTIRVAVEADGQWARLTVTDRGVGIPAHRLPSIFDRFERAGSPLQYGGFGLGLFIVRRIAEALGGTASAASSPEAGTIFTIELPRTGPSTAMPAAPSGHSG
jgi:signal transduction histidine kinase